MKAKTITDLNRIYNEAEEVDRELFAEQRSNILLVAGDHYSRISARITNQVRQSNQLAAATNENKLRLTKNHMHKIHRAYVTAILSESPGVTVIPQRDTELQDQKDAELNLAVWQNIKNKHRIKQKILDWCSNFVGIGEVCLKVFWDPMAGKLTGYEPLLDEMGAPVLEPSGQMDPMTGQPQMVPSLDKEKPTFEGDIVFEDVYGFNLLREVGTEDMADPYKAWIVRKMVDTKVLKDRYGADQDIVSKIQESSDRTYIVFDNKKGSYEKKKGETLLREFYWRPSETYPEGYFMYATDTVILQEGPLPEGLFPLIWQGFDKYPTTPRGRSILKVARPYQAEINRASSKVAETQITLGDDKLIYSAGAKLAPGTLIPGIRGISVSGGQVPTVLPGRNGAQYLDYVNAQIAEMYAAVMLDDMDVMDKSGQMDPYALLFRAASQKRKYSPYIEKFEQFMVDTVELCLRICKTYLPDDCLIPAVGSAERINIAEFRNTEPLSYKIKVEPQSDTVESTFGRQLTFQNLLQYVGKQLDPKILGKILKNLPYGNFGDTIEDMTIDEDMARNDMLALERGEPVQPTPYVDPEYMIKKLTSRNKKADFRFLSPQIQMAYAQLIQQYEGILADQEAKIAAAKNEYIPVDGAMVACDFYVPDPQHPENQAKRARIPQRAIEWLLKRLEEQGMSMDKLEGMNTQSMAELAQMLQQRQAGAAGGQPPPQIAG